MNIRKGLHIATIDNLGDRLIDLSSYLEIRGDSVATTTERRQIGATEPRKLRAT